MPVTEAHVFFTAPFGATVIVRVTKEGVHVDSRGNELRLTRDQLQLLQRLAELIE